MTYIHITDFVMLQQDKEQEKQHEEQQEEQKQQQDKELQKQQQDKELLLQQQEEQKEEQKGKKGKKGKKTPENIARLKAERRARKAAKKAAKKAAAKEQAGGTAATKVQSGRGKRWENPLPKIGSKQCNAIWFVLTKDSSEAAITIPAVQGLFERHPDWVRVGKDGILHVTLFFYDKNRVTDPNDLERLDRLLDLAKKKTKVACKARRVIYNEKVAGVTVSDIRTEDGIAVNGFAQHPHVTVLVGPNGRAKDTGFIEEGVRYTYSNVYWTQFKGRVCAVRT